MTSEQLSACIPRDHKYTCSMELDNLKKSVALPEGESLEGWIVLNSAKMGVT